MSRLERERWMLSQARWPNLQLFLSQAVPDVVLGEASTFPGKIRTKFSEIDISIQSAIAQECWDFLSTFKDRHDDWNFLRDGFGITGEPLPDHKGRGQTALSRMKLVYSIFAETIRMQQPEWKPTS